MDAGYENLQIFKRPQLFVTSGVQLQVNPDIIREVEQITCPILTVSSIGREKVGKSYLLNRLQNHESGFQLNSATGSKTKGIWIKCIKVPCFGEKVIALLDTEGIQSQDDLRIQSLATFLSSFVIFNISNCITEYDLSILFEIIKWKENTPRQKKIGTSHLIVALKNIKLPLAFKGKPASADEYLEGSLQKEDNDDLQYRIVKQTIKSGFKTRKCLKFPRPTSSKERLRKLAQLPDNMLNEEFLERVNEMKDIIYNYDSPVFQEGKDLANMIGEYCAEIESISPKRGVGSAADIVEINQTTCSATADCVPRVVMETSAVPEARNLINADQHFLYTRQMQEAVAVLSNKGSLVISGCTGEGKTATAACILKHNFNILKLIVINSPQQLNPIDTIKTEAILIEDIFGVYSLDQGLFTKWVLMMPRLIKYIKKHHIKLVITTDNDILAACRSQLARFSIFDNVLECSSNKLSYTEKLHILCISCKNRKRYMPYSKTHKCVRVYQGKMGFPLCCQLFCSDLYLFALGPLFFRHPFRFLHERLSLLSGPKFASLVFLFCSGGSIQISKLSDEDSECYDKLQHICSALEVNPSLTSTDVKYNFATMDGVYLKTSGNIVTFMHSTVAKAIGKLFGKTDSTYVIKACSRDFLHQCIAIDTGIGDNTRGSITDLVIQRRVEMQFSINTFPFFVDRLIFEVTENQDIIRVAANPVLRNSKWLGSFMKIVQEENCQKEFFATSEKKIPLMKFTTDMYFLSAYFRLIPDQTNLCQLLSYIERTHAKPCKSVQCWTCKVLYDCLNVCCESGNKKAGELLISKGAIPDSTTVNFAVGGGNASLLTTVLTHGGMPDRETMFLAIRSGNVDVVKVVVDHGPSLQEQSLKWAIEQGDEEIVHLLLSRKAFRDQDVFNCAALEGRYNIVKLLFEYGASANTESVNCAVVGGNIDLLKLVMKHGAEPNIETLNVAVERGNSEIVRMLIQSGISPNTETITCAVIGGNVDIFNVLVAHGAKPDIETLNCSIQAGSNIAIITEVMRHSVMPNLKTLHTALQVDDIDVIKIVTERVATIDMEALALAIKKGNVDLLTTVVARSPVPDINTLNYAIHGGNINIVRALLENGAVPVKENSNHAVCAGDVDIARMVMRNGALPDTEHLERALLEGNIGIVETALELGAKPEIDLLNFAAQEGKLDLFSMLKSICVPDKETLSSAVRGGNIDIVRAAILTVDVPDIEFVNAAALEGNAAIVSLLLEHGAVPASYTLTCAVRGGNVEAVWAVIKHGVTPDIGTINFAAARGNADIVNALMDIGVVPNSQTVKYAVLKREVDVVKLLLERGVVPNVETLNCSVRDGNLDIVRALLEKGVVPTEVTVNAAIYKGNSDIVRAVLENACKPNTDTLNLSVRIGNANVVKVIMEHGVIPDTTTLNLAAKMCVIDVVKAVLVHGVIPNKESLINAVIQSNVDIVKTLMNHNFLPDQETLMYAIDRGKVDIVKAVLEYGAPADAPCLHIAARKGIFDIFKAVQEMGAIPDIPCLYFSVYGGDVNIVKMVMNFEIDPAACRSAFDLACDLGKTDIAAAIKERITDKSI